MEFIVKTGYQSFTCHEISAIDCPNEVGGIGSMRCRRVWNLGGIGFTPFYVDVNVHFTAVTEILWGPFNSEHVDTMHKLYTRMEPSIFTYEHWYKQAHLLRERLLGPKPWDEAENMDGYWKTYEHKNNPIFIPPPERYAHECVEREQEKLKVKMKKLGLPFPVLKLS